VSEDTDSDSDDEIEATGKEGGRGVGGSKVFSDDGSTTSSAFRRTATMRNSLAKVNKHTAAALHCTALLSLSFAVMRGVLRGVGDLCMSFVKK
jgi:hypothetical protein